MVVGDLEWWHRDLSKSIILSVDENMVKIIIIGIGIAVVVCIVTAIIEVLFSKEDKDSLRNYIEGMKKGK